MNTKEIIAELEEEIKSIEQTQKELDLKAISLRRIVSELEDISFPAVFPKPKKAKKTEKTKKSEKKPKTAETPKKVKKTLEKPKIDLRKTNKGNGHPKAAYDTPEIIKIAKNNTELYAPELAELIAKETGCQMTQWNVKSLRKKYNIKGPGRGGLKGRRKQYKKKIEKVDKPIDNIVDKWDPKVKDYINKNYNELDKASLIYNIEDKFKISLTLKDISNYLDTHKLRRTFIGKKPKEPRVRSLATLRARQERVDEIKKKNEVQEQLIKEAPEFSNPLEEDMVNFIKERRNDPDLTQMKILSLMNSEFGTSITSHGFKELCERHKIKFGSGIKDELESPEFVN